MTRKANSNPSSHVPAHLMKGRSAVALSQQMMNHKAMVAMARMHTQDCIEYLVRVLHTPKAAVQARVKAAEIIMAYGWGKPPQAIAITSDTPTPGQGLQALSVQERVKAITETYLGPTKKAIELEARDVRPTERAGEEYV